MPPLTPIGFLNVGTLVVFVGALLLSVWLARRPRSKPLPAVRLAAIISAIAALPVAIFVLWVSLFLRSVAMENLKYAASQGAVITLDTSSGSTYASIRYPPGSPQRSAAVVYFTPSGVAAGTFSPYLMVGIVFLVPTYLILRFVKPRPQLRGFAVTPAAVPSTSESPPRSRTE